MCEGEDGRGDNFWAVMDFLRESLPRFVEVGDRSVSPPCPIGSAFLHLAHIQRPRLGEISRGTANGQLHVLGFITPSIISRFGYLKFPILYKKYIISRSYCF